MGMSDGFWQAFFSNMAPIIGAIFTGIVAVLMALMNVKMNNVQRKQDTIEKNTNGMTQQLVADAEKRGYTKGHTRAVNTIKEVGANAAASAPMPLAGDDVFSQEHL